MPQASPHLQILRGLTKEELQVIPDRCRWCHVRETGGSISELSKRIRDSIDTNVAEGNITYAEAMRDIRLEVLRPGSQTVTQKIRTILRETPVAISKGGGDTGGARESWYTAQLYGALSTAIIRPYTVKLEHSLNHRNKPKPDIYVESQANDGDYVIEVKRASANLRAADIGRQLNKYHRAIAQDKQRDREMTFLCIVGEDEGMDTIGESRKSTPLSEYMAVTPAIDELEENLDRVEVISCTFEKS
jgi:hypothetical protein